MVAPDSPTSLDTQRGLWAMPMPSQSDVSLSMLFPSSKSLPTLSCVWELSIVRSGLLSLRQFIQPVPKLSCSRTLGNQLQTARTVTPALSIFLTSSSFCIAKTLAHDLTATKVKLESEIQPWKRNSCKRSSFPHPFSPYIFMTGQDGKEEKDLEEQVHSTVQTLPWSTNKLKEIIVEM